MSNVLEWKPEFETGNLHIDQQHRYLLDLANDVQVALETNEEEDVVLTAFEELIAYTEYHFRDEEAYWKTIGSQALKAQERAHERLADELRSLIYPVNSDSVGKNLLDWLKRELITHMTKHDQLAVKAASEKK
ncbi:MAG: hemerythrin family protein [Alphaproteobacteria bacterium]|nr:hemerythrin family protein [Alphaproteobacteria bacterium]